MCVYWVAILIGKMESLGRDAGSKTVFDDFLVDIYFFLDYYVHSLWSFKGHVVVITKCLNVWLC